MSTAIWLRNCIFKKIPAALLRSRAFHFDFSWLKSLLILSQAVHVIQSAGGIVIFPNGVHVTECVFLFLLGVQAIHVIEAAGTIIFFGNSVHIGQAQSAFAFVLYVLED